MLHRRLIAVLALIALAIQLAVVDANIGPGIDSNRDGALYLRFGNYITSNYNTNKIRIDFYAEAGTYRFFIGFGVEGDAVRGVIRFSIPNKAEKSFNAQNMYFTTVELFTVELSSGFYSLYIELIDFYGSLILLTYPKDSDPSVSYYYDSNFNMWVDLSRDIAFAVSDENNTYIPPSFTYSVFIDEKVCFNINAINFKPKSNITIRFSYDVTVKADDNGRFSGVVCFNTAHPGDYLLIAGYDVLGNLVVLRTSELNITFASTSWLDTVVSLFNALVSYVSLAFSIVVSLIPYAGVFYMLAFFGVVFKCVNELSILPLFNFFYKQYDILVNIAQLMIKVAEKVYEGTKTLIDFLIKLIDVIL